MSKYCSGAAPMVAHGVRADSDPVASSEMADESHQSYSNKMELTVMLQEVGPDYFLCMFSNLRAASSMNRRRQQRKSSWTSVE
jgi:hypothetical protein